MPLVIPLICQKAIILAVLSDMRIVGGRGDTPLESRAGNEEI